MASHKNDGPPRKAAWEAEELPGAAFALGAGGPPSLADAAAVFAAAAAAAAVGVAGGRDD